MPCNGIIIVDHIFFFCVPFQMLNLHTAGPGMSLMTIIFFLFSVHFQNIDLILLVKAIHMSC